MLLCYTMQHYYTYYTTQQYTTTHTLNYTFTTVHYTTTKRNATDCNVMINVSSLHLCIATFISIRGPRPRPSVGPSTITQGSHFRSYPYFIMGDFGVKDKKIAVENPISGDGPTPGSHLSAWIRFKSQTAAGLWALCVVCIVPTRNRSPALTTPGLIMYLFHASTQNCVSDAEMRVIARAMAWRSLKRSHRVFLCCQLHLSESWSFAVKYSTPADGGDGHDGSHGRTSGSQSRWVFLAGARRVLLVEYAREKLLEKLLPPGSALLCLPFELCHLQSPSLALLGGCRFSWGKAR